MPNEEPEVDPQDDWHLDSVKIEFKRYGENKGKYEGSIKFQNGEHESFSFNIRPDMAQPYIDLMAENIVTAASQLGERLIKALKLEGHSESNFS